MQEYFKTYLNQIKTAAYREAIRGTVGRFHEVVLDEFDWVSDRQGLLFGEVQSGKTSHVLGIIGEALDEGFETVVFLTSDNVRLANQTFERAYMAFPDVTVCNSLDEKRFKLSKKGAGRPVIVVLGKNKDHLKKWSRYLTEAEALNGKPLLVIDDEADNASLNNAVNDKKTDRTAINKALTKLKESASSYIYLQVTGTPQAVILQTEKDQWKPDFIFSFEPGEGYIGGDTLFGSSSNPHIHSFSQDQNDETDELEKAIATYLITSALLYSDGNSCCNMLIHTSRKKEDHEDVAFTVRNFLAKVKRGIRNDKWNKFFGEVWETELKSLSRRRDTAEQVNLAVNKFIDEVNVATVIVNSDSRVDDEDLLQTGFNVVVGGDSLGRGLTIPKLQTVFYSRHTKTPQADTMWQHARMFGYDRKSELLKIFMPEDVLESFQKVHLVNESIKQQLNSGIPVNQIHIEHDPTIRPTRPTVVDNDHLFSLKGGVSYFASDPVIENFEELDKVLKHRISDGYSIVNLKTIITILRFFDDRQGFPFEDFVNVLGGIAKADPNAEAKLLIRTGRKVTQGKGTLLSPNDRAIVDSIDDVTSLTLYQIDADLGWSRNPIWVPNIKLPGNKTYLRTREN